ncbi:hypothetical protein LV779_15810 [Streptomyces thinghirensis]|nr:hypothetical protein [Streptomyces thinghirensis]
MLQTSYPRRLLRDRLLPAVRTPSARRTATQHAAEYSGAQLRGPAHQRRCPLLLVRGAQALPLPEARPRRSRPPP